MKQVFFIACAIFLMNWNNYCCQSLKIRCPLLWQPYTLNDPLPNNSVNIESENAVVRWRNSKREFTVGRFTKDSGAFIVDTIHDVILDNPSPLEILVNMHDCEIEWVHSFGGAPESEFLTKSGTGNIVVGRNDDQFPGEVNNGLITYVNQNHQIIGVASFSYLTSFSNRILLEYTTIDFESELPAELEFVGLDEISNIVSSGATVSQSMEHSKSVTETMSFTNGRSWGSITEFSINVKVELKLEGVNATLPSAEIGYNYRKEDETAVSESLGTEKTKTIAFAREITVPANIRIQACTIIAKVEDFTTKYTATGKYTIRGWTGSEIAEYLRASDPPLDLKIERDHVTTVESGEFSGSLYSNNVLIVKEKSPDNDCSALSYYIYKLIDMKRQGKQMGKYAAEIRSLENKIDKIITPEQLNVIRLET